MVACYVNLGKTVQCHIKPLLVLELFLFLKRLDSSLFSQSEYYLIFLLKVLSLFLFLEKLKVMRIKVLYCRNVV